MHLYREGFDDRTAYLLPDVPDWNVGADVDDADIPQQQRIVDRAEDVREPDLGQVSRQNIAPVWPLLGCHETDAAELLEDLGQEVVRHAQVDLQGPKLKRFSPSGRMASLNRVVYVSG